MVSIGNILDLQFRVGGSNPSGSIIDFIYNEVNNRAVAIHLFYKNI